ncbi:MAG: hypothetical protein GF350_05265, partial [Chitinivibrionales bacterium]|nr:hypothetical protein [Chitinivibrionales bacterium]
EGQTGIINLCRCGWAGSQKYGAAIWSGDIPSTFESLREQIPAGLNMAMSGIPWWNTDIGGFKGGNPEDEQFRELIVRWFQYAVFTPVFRLHGVREPSSPFTGGDNEIWSFGEEAYTILKEYLFMRERLRPYIREQMKLAHKNAVPPMRPLFFDFPGDQTCYDIADQFMFGPDIMVAPVVEYRARDRRVYFPAGAGWKNAWSDDVVDGGQWMTVDAPIERAPVFLRNRASVPIVNGWKDVADA